MKNYENNSRQKGFEIDIIGYLLNLSKKWWLIVIIAMLFGMLGGIVGKVTSGKTYTSQVSFIVSTLKDNQTAENSAISAQLNIANTYVYILSSRGLKEAVQEACPGNVPYSIIDESIKVSVVPSTFVVEMDITTDNPETSYNIAKTITNVYDDIITETYPNATLRVCDNPVKATLPEFNRSAVVFSAISAVLGIAIYCLISLVIFIIRDTIKTSEQLADKLGYPVLGSLQLVTNKNNNTKGLLIVDRKTGFSFIETYKSIRTKIENNSSRTGNKVYLVSSACENEGKTTVSVNLALSLAENGKSVLIIDADLRNPSVNKLLSLPNSGPGFSDVIKGSSTLEQAIKFVKSFNLYVLADSESVSNPSELLSTKATEQIISNLKDEFDYIIVDTTPASLVTDTSVMAGIADAAIMVVRSDTAPFSRIRMSVEDIDSNGSEIVGCIFNGDESGLTNRTKYGKYSRYGKYGKYGKYGTYGYGGNKSKK